ncbi:MAG: VOC family protein [Oscillospiraceae bacterium]|nr:VOC family protein [Oscillospiraceae bacterium]
MKIDNFYFVVDNIEESIAFYTELLDEKPTNITDDRWADWKNENNQIYFGIISKEATGSKQIKGNNGVLGLYTDDIEGAYKKCMELKAKILYEPEAIPDSKDNYKCFAIEDLDGNKIEISYYDK